MQTYTENGVQYDVAGLLSTARGMTEWSMIRKILLLNIDRIIMNPNQILNTDYLDYQITDDVRWVIEHMMKLVILQTRDNQKQIYNKVSTI